MNPFDLIRELRCTVTKDTEVDSCVKAQLSAAANLIEQQTHSILMLVEFLGKQ